MKDTIPDWAIRTKSDHQAIKEGAVWDQSQADKIIKFAEAFVHPQFITGKFKLLEWQKKFLSNLYGWRWSNGRRRWRFANLGVSKKNGKTLLISIIALYELLASGEPSSMPVVCAASKENASQVFKELKHSLEKSFPGQVEDHTIRIATHTKRIYIPSINAEFRTFASQGSRIHGEPVSCGLFDEVSQWKDPEVFRAMRYNTDARPNGMCVAISNAGVDTSHFYYQQVYQKSKRILSGEDTDPTWYAEIWEADPKSDFEKDESQWHRSNPSLLSGVSFPVEQFRRDLNAAKEHIGTWLTFMRLKLSIWCRDSDTVWLDTSDFDRYKKDIPDEELKDCECVIGVDLSEVSDPTSVSIVFDLGDRNYYVKSWCWVPEAGLKFRAKTTLPKFEIFIAEGSMVATDGNMIDRNKVRDHILDLCKTYPRLKAVNFDPHASYVLANDIEAEGYTTGRMVQSARNFNGPMTEFARAYKEGRITHDNSSWLRYTLGNVRVQVDKYGDIRPYKKASPDPAIDGAIATLLGFVSIFAPDPNMTPGVIFI